MARSMLRAPRMRTLVFAARASILSLAKLADSAMRDERGALSAEYVILVGTVGLIAAGALVSIGPEILAGYQHARDTLASPVP